MKASTAKAQLKSDFAIKDAVFDLMDALQAPILTFDTSWADMIPDRLKKVIPIARMKACMQNEELATYPEITAYLYTRSAVAPMDSNWTDIYCYVSCVVCEQYFQEDHWNDVEAKTITPWQMSELTQLRRKLYNRRRELLKKQMSNGNTK